MCPLYIHSYGKIYMYVAICMYVCMDILCIIYYVNNSVISQDKDLDPFIVPITNIYSTMGADCYATQAVKLALFRTIGPKVVYALEIIIFKNLHTMVGSISQHNISLQAIKICGKAIWTVHLIYVISSCANFSHKFAIQCKI